MGAFLDRAEAAGLEVVTPVLARCSPSGPVEDEAFEIIADSIVSALKHGCDAMLLDLHGAMVVQSYPDGEGELLRRLRAADPEVPIALALDSHANVTAEMVELATVVVGYRTYPHVDVRECGERAFDARMDAIAGRTNPVMSFGNVPLLASTLCTDTAEEPMRSLVAAARVAEENPSIIAATLFAGFPLSDTAQAGISCVVIADDDLAAAHRVRDEILRAAWSERESLIYVAELLTVSIDRAEELAQSASGPILLIDHADNCNSGGTLDSMTVVREVLRRKLDNVAVAPICDPAVAARLHEAGVGACLSIRLGEKAQSPLVRVGDRRPLPLSGRVTALSRGSLTVKGPVFTGSRFNMGLSAAFESDGVTFIICSRRVEPYDLGVFSAFGIDPRAKRFLVLKSRIQYRPVFLPIAAGKVDCNGSGVASSDLGLFRFERVRRPIFPLDRDVEWDPRHEDRPTSITGLRTDPMH